jgi:23S rRNA (adenine-N6)-dimethyltransferase
MPINKKFNESERKLKHSQNFITQPQLVKQLVKIADINSKDDVLEIGAGRGIITQELLRHAGRVIAIEQDVKLLGKLDLLRTHGNLELLIGDFRKLELPQKDFKVFSNIPFDITTDILTKLVSPKSKATDIYLLMQEEAAKRFAGMPHHRNSQNSTLLAVDFSVEVKCKISRDHFDPKPNANIVFAHFSKLAPSLVPEADRQDFRDFVVYGYNQWAPSLLDAYKKIFSHKQLLVISKSQGLKGLKPSDLTIREWLELFNTYRLYVNEDKKVIVRSSEELLRKGQKKLSKWNRSRSY